MPVYLVNAVVLSEGRKEGGLAVGLQDDRIASVIAADQLPEGAETVDLTGCFLAPGFIDLQVYGSGGALFGGVPSERALRQMEADFIRHGTTGFLATVATNSDAIVDAAIRAAVSFRRKSNGSFLGLHLEGPYLNVKRRGAHPAEYIKKGSVAELNRWSELADGTLRMMTVAPELQDADFLQRLHELGIRISCGHTDATFEEAIGFLHQPVEAATHLYNAMPLLHHRNPGLIPALFWKRPFTSIVADGVHVSFPMISLAKEVLRDRLFLITDAVTATDEGLYPHVFAGDRYTLPDGTLSGSCLTMLTAVRNCVRRSGILLAEAVNMASLYPAQLLGEDHHKGKILPGYRADLAAFTEDFEPVSTWLGGAQVYAR